MLGTAAIAHEHTHAICFTTLAPVLALALVLALVLVQTHVSMSGSCFNVRMRHLHVEDDTVQNHYEVLVCL
jgi:hypothetical protein